VEDKKDLYRLMSSASIVEAITSRKIARKGSEGTMEEMTALHEKLARADRISKAFAASPDNLGQIPAPYLSGGRPELDLHPFTVSSLHTRLVILTVQSHPHNQKY
jgi:hypothetical protein